MKTVNPFIVPYDAGSRIGKVSQSLHAWKKIFPKSIFLERQYSDLLPFMVEAEVYRTIEKNQIPLLLGGDHSLTYYACKALTSIYGPLHILVFDAHHDSYPATHLNHYTVFHHMQSRLKSKITLIGCRKDLDKNSIIKVAKSDSPFYLSVDLDFFSPNFIKSVVDPVACENDDKYSFDTFCMELQEMNGKILGADIVEWGGEEESSEEYHYVKKISEKLYSLIESSP